jgi:lipopolysaccharide transport system permease protein
MSDVARPRPLIIIRPPSTFAGALSGAVPRLIEYRDLFVTLSRHRLSVRYKQSLLGGLWAVLQPLAMMLVFTAVFSRLVRMPSDGVPYALFAYAGLLPWTLFSTSVTAATGSLVANASLLTKVALPREILPATYVIVGVVDLLIASTALLPMIVVFGIALTPAVLWVVPILIVLGAFSLGVGLLLSAMQVRFRDVSMALTVALQLWMFASPVLYPLRAVPARSYGWYVLNPMAGLVDAFRRAVIGQPIDAYALGVATAITIALLPLSYLVFKQLDVTIADVI